MMGIEVNQTIQLIAYIVTAVVFIVMIKADVKIIKVEMNGIRENLKVLNNSFGKLTELLSITAVQDLRVNRLEEDIKELKHGRGFVQDAINREWGKQ